VIPAALNTNPTQNSSTWYCVANVTRPAAPMIGAILAS